MVDTLSIGVTSTYPKQAVDNVYALLQNYKTRNKHNNNNNNNNNNNKRPGWKQNNDQSGGPKGGKPAVWGEQHNIANNKQKRDVICYKKCGRENPHIVPKCTETTTIDRKRINHESNDQPYGPNVQGTAHVTWAKEIGEETNPDNFDFSNKLGQEDSYMQGNDQYCLNMKHMKGRLDRFWNTMFLVNVRKYPIISRSTGGEWLQGRLHQSGQQGRIQRQVISCGDHIRSKWVGAQMAGHTVEALEYILDINAMKDQDVTSFDLPAQFLQTDMDTLLFLKITGALALLLVKYDSSKRWKKYLQKQSGRPTIYYLQCKKAIHRTLSAAILAYKKLTGHFEEWGLKVNQYGPCVWNKTINR
eukprot:jgi/Psemu1/49356/gm1.49356_g